MTGDELRVVVDTQLVLSMFLRRYDQPEHSSATRLLLRLLDQPGFIWLWSGDVLDDYRRGAFAVENNPRISARAYFDRDGFELLLAILQLRPEVEVSAETLRAARRRLEQATTSAHRDLDDAVFLACAIDGEARVLASKDSDLTSLGSEYEGVRIVSWQELVEELRAYGLL
jgi:predicted nucleic acid-binding protein